MKINGVSYGIIELFGECLHFVSLASIQSTGGEGGLIILCLENSVEMVFLNVYEAFHRRHLKSLCPPELVNSEQHVPSALLIFGTVFLALTTFLQFCLRKKFLIFSFPRQFGFVWYFQGTEDSNFM